MRIDVITLFPEVFEALTSSIPGRAQASGALTLGTYQLRRHAVNRHGQVDDAPYGGEAGMVLRPEPLRAALQAVLEQAAATAAATGPGASFPATANTASAANTADSLIPRDRSRAQESQQEGECEGRDREEEEGKSGGNGPAFGGPGEKAPLGGEGSQKGQSSQGRDTGRALLATQAAQAGGSQGARAPGRPHVVYMSAQGARLTQQRAAELALLPHLVIVCGHYKGVDQRFLDGYVNEEISIGDYVLSGGELPAMVLIDSIARLLPGVLGDIDSADTDSHALPGRLGWPVYTRPAVFEGREVPEVLLSGHHAHIEKWRTLESLRLTRERRPDLLHAHPLTETERNLLDPPVKKRRKRVP